MCARFEDPKSRRFWAIQAVLHGTVLTQDDVKSGNAALYCFVFPNMDIDRPEMMYLFGKLFRDRD
jgi:hypothetical protein